MNISRILVLTLCTAAALSASAGFVRMKTNRDGTDWINAGLWAFPLPTACDFNADGIPDIVLGAEDGFFYYLQNPRR